MCSTDLSSQNHLYLPDLSVSLTNCELIAVVEVAENGSLCPENYCKFAMIHCYKLFRAVINYGHRSDTAEIHF